MNFFKRKRQHLFFVVTQIGEDVHVEYCLTYSEAHDYCIDFLKHFSELNPSCSIFKSEEILSW